MLYCWRILFILLGSAFLLSDQSVRVPSFAAKQKDIDRHNSISAEVQGEQYFFAGQFEKAIACYDKAVQLWTDCSAYLNRAKCHEKLGNYDLAIKDYSWFIDSGKAKKLGSIWASETYTGRAHCYLMLGKPEPALADCESAREFSTKPIMGEKKAATVNLLTGWANLLKGQAERALSDLNLYVSLNPEEAQGYFIRARAFNALGRFQQAAKDLAQALEMNENDTLALAELALASAGIGENEKAAEMADKVISFNPASYKAWLAKAWAMQSLGHEQEAEQAADKALSLKPNSFIAAKIKNKDAKLADGTEAPPDDPPVALLNRE